MDFFPESRAGLTDFKNIRYVGKLLAVFNGAKICPVMLVRSVRRMFRLGNLRLAACLVLLLGCAATAQESSLLLRAHEGKTTFRVGEPVILEVACVDASGSYLSLCFATLRVEPRAGGKLSLDPVDSFMLRDVLCAQYQVAFCGTPVDRPQAQQSSRPKWHEVTLDEHFPASAGLYSVTASVNSLFGTPSESFSAKPETLEITIADDPDWKAKVLHFEDCKYDKTLTVLPDARDAIAALRDHLGDCAKQNDDILNNTIAAIVWLDLQSNHAEIYQRIREFHSIHSSDSLHSPQRREPAHIRRWVHARYRALVLETANQLVREYQSHPDKRSDADYNDEFDDAFTNWQKSITVGCHLLLSAPEIQRLLRAVGRSDEYIRDFLHDLDGYF